MMGAKTISFDLKEKNLWLPDLENIDPKALAAAKMMWVNYPNMPTGQKASKKLFAKLSNFAQEHNLLMVNDNPYSFILNDGPISLLSAPGAMGNCLELNSMSKAFNMAGWRVGMVCGRKEYVDAILNVKSNVDSGMFRPVQEASVEALNLPTAWFDELNAGYRKKKELATKILDTLGCAYDDKQSGMFIWAKIPEGEKSEMFIEEILQEKSVFIPPGTVFGTNGEGYIRISLCPNKEMFGTAIQRLKMAKT